MEHYTKCYLFSSKDLLLERVSDGNSNWKIPTLEIKNYSDRFLLTRNELKNRTNLIVDGFLEHGEYSVYNGKPEPLKLFSILSVHRFSGSLLDKKNFSWFNKNEINLEHLASSDMEQLSRVVLGERFNVNVKVDENNKVIREDYSPRVIA